LSVSEEIVMVKVANCRSRIGDHFALRVASKDVGIKKGAANGTDDLDVQKSDIRENLVVKLGVAFVFIGGQKLDCRSRVKIHLARDVVGD